MIATIAIMIILENAAIIAFGADLRGANTAYTASSFALGPVLVPLGPALAAAGSVITIVLLGMFLKLTYYGNAVIAAADNLLGAHVSGIPVKRVYLLAFALSTALASVAGVLLLPFTVVGPFVGTEMIVKAFVITIIGGLGSISGALLAGLLVGIAEALATLYASGSYGNAIVFALLILTLIVRPSGLLPARGG